MLRILFQLLVVFSLVLPALGQVTTLTDKNQLSSGRILLDFDSHERGTAKGDLFGRWGIRMNTSDDSNFKIDGFTSGILGFEIRFLQNSSSNAATSVIIDFDYPVKEAGFVLRGPDAATATLRAYAPLGTQVGTVQTTGLSPTGGKFLGLKTTSQAGITKIIVDYGTSTYPEEIVEFYYKAMSDKEFVSYLSHLADGTIAGFGALQTIIIVANLSNTTATGELQFFGNNGAPLELDFVGGDSFSSTQFALEPFASMSWSTTGTSSPPVPGYARIYSKVPMEGTAIFQLVDLSGTPISEAGVGSAPGRYQAVGGVTVGDALNFDSGLAYVNVGDSDADLQLVLLSESGEHADSIVIPDIPPGAHDAAFLTGLFPSLLNADFSGTLLIVADEPIASTILRTINGLVLSSLPVGSTQQ